jgi:hypothetical protein
MFFGYLNFRQDDAYIFYTYAKNIAEGNGYVYNLGERINATTSPLYTLLLAALYIVTKNFSIDIFPLLGNLIGVTSLAAIILSVKNIWKNSDEFKFFPLILLANPLLKFGFGMETFLNLALITLSVLMFTKKKYEFAFLFAGLSVLARLDSVLFAGILLFFYIIKNKNLFPIKLIMILILTVAPWFIFSFFYFDSFLPTTIAVKLSQEKFQMHGAGLIFLKGFFNALPGTLFSAIILVIGFFVSTFYLIKRKSVLLLNEGILIIFFYFGILFFIYAFILNTPPYQWYYTPFAIPLSILFTYFLSDIINKKSINYFTITCLFMIATILPLKTISQGFNPKYSNYTEAIEWLNKNVSNNTILGVDEIGIMGYYYKKGKIVDALGLVNPEVVPHLNQKDFGWYISKYQPDFIINDYPKIMNHSGRDDERFVKHYHVIKIFESHGEKIAVYKKRTEIQNLN